MLEPGTKGHMELTVEDFMTAQRMKSGNLAVLATPYLAAVMEQTCADSVGPQLEQGMSTVGTSLNIKHLAATPVGMKLVCDTVLTEVDRRRLVFSVEVRDERELVGTGVHERFIIDVDRFMEKVRAKGLQ